MSIEVIEEIKRAILEYNREAAARLAKKAIEEKIEALEVMEALTNAIREVGEKFGTGELWLPELIGAAAAMTEAMPILEGEIIKKGVERKGSGTVVIGTVYGDLHSIGKSMVGVLLMANGFTVNDVGINVTSEQFVEAVREYKPDILAMSSLLTTTAPEQRKVIDALKKEGLRDKVKIMVGGGAITQQFADEIGADGYDPTAPGAVELARTLLGKQRRE